MKQLFIILSVTMLLHTAVHAQFIATPGQGVGNAMIGMSIKALSKLLGEPISSSTYESEKQSWKNSGYDTDKEFVYDISWEKVYIFEDNNPFGIWKVYAKDDTATIFSISTFISNTSVFNNIYLPNKLRFFNDTTRLVACMGNDYTKGNNKQREFIYLNKGITFLVLDLKLTNVFIYKPMRTKEACSDGPLYVLL